MRRSCVGLMLVFMMLPIPGTSAAVVEDPTMHAGVDAKVGAIVVSSGCELDSVRAHVSTHASPPVYMYYSIDNGFSSDSGPMGLTQSDGDLPWGAGVSDSNRWLDWGETITLTAYITTRLEVDEGDAAWIFSDDARVSMDITCDANLRSTTYTASDGGETLES